MIRPVLLPQTPPVRSRSYRLDQLPYEVDYTLKALDPGLAEFQFNLYGFKRGGRRLLERIYFQADSVETLREAMFAGKYFDPEDGAFKLVFYPGQGQTDPRRSVASAD